MAESQFPEDATSANKILKTSSSTATDDDAASVGSASSAKSEERRRRREHWRREHENQLKVDGTFPRRVSGENDRSAVSAKVVQHLGTKTTAKLHTLPPAVSDSVRVRSNLLRTLGIQQKQPQQPSVGYSSDDIAAANGEGGKKGGTNRHRRIQSVGEVTIQTPKTPPPSSRPLLSEVRMNEELKYDSDDDTNDFNNTKATNNYSRFFGLNKVSNSAPSTPTNNLKQIPRRRRLVFHDNVEVVPIPMRSEYSNRIKERMYSGRVELSENAQRNVVEFEAEGWDASTVLDDENQFYKCPLTGELIHPVHLSYFNKGDDGNDDQ